MSRRKTTIILTTAIVVVIAGIYIAGSMMSDANLDADF